MKKIMFFIFLCIVFFFTALIWYGNSNVKITEYTVESEKIPDGFDGFTIAQVSDYHNTKVGNLGKKTINLLKNTNCDIIVMTGDMLDSRNTDIGEVIDFCKKALEIAPCYYVTGNHEARIKDDYGLLKEKLLEIGITILEDETIEIEKNGERITLIGLLDVGFHNTSLLNNQLKDIMPDNESFKILLSHRPELFDSYTDVDLVFSGHAHGGQIRIPRLGGLFSPGQGFFPEFDKGLYEKSGVKMILSAGIGNSLFPIRINNDPEVVLCKLKGGQ